MYDSLYRELKAKAENSVCPKCGSTNLGAIVKALVPVMLYMLTEGEWVVESAYIGDWANATYCCNECEWSWGTGQKSRYQGWKPRRRR